MKVPEQALIFPGSVVSMKVVGVVWKTTVTYPITCSVTVVLSPVVTSVNTTFRDPGRMFVPTVKIPLIDPEPSTVPPKPIPWPEIPVANCPVQPPLGVKSDPK